MILATPGFVLRTTPYGDSSVVVKAFTRQLGVRSYIVKGVRGPRGRIKQNLLQPLSSLDMVVYDNHHHELNHIKEITPRHPEVQENGQSDGQAVANALRFFVTEVLYKTLPEAEPMPELFDFVEETTNKSPLHSSHYPISFLLALAHYLGIEPLDNYSSREPLFDLQEGRYVGAPSETTLPPVLSFMLHEYLSTYQSVTVSAYQLTDRRSLIDALLAYYQLHLPGFHDFHSHEILHTILR